MPVRGERQVRPGTNATSCGAERASRAGRVAPASPPAQSVAPSRLRMRNAISAPPSSSVRRRSSPSRPRRARGTRSTIRGRARRGPGPIASGPSIAIVPSIVELRHGSSTRSPRPGRGPLRERRARLAGGPAASSRTRGRSRSRAPGRGPGSARRRARSDQSSRRTSVVDVDAEASPRPARAARWSCTSRPMPASAIAACANRSSRGANALADDLGDARPVAEERDLHAASHAGRVGRPPGDVPPLGAEVRVAAVVARKRDGQSPTGRPDTRRRARPARGRPASDSTAIARRRAGFTSPPSPPHRRRRRSPVARSPGGDRREREHRAAKRGELRGRQIAGPCSSGTTGG